MSGWVRTDRKVGHYIDPMASIETRKVVAGVALVAITVAAAAWSLRTHHPEGAVVAVIVVIGTVVSQGNRD